METLSNRRGSRRHSAAKLGIGAFGILFLLSTQQAVSEESTAESFVLSDNQMDKVTAGEPGALALFTIGAYSFAQFCALNCTNLYALYSAYEGLISEVYRAGDGDPVAFKRELYSGVLNIPGGSVGSGYAGAGAGGGGGESWGGQVDTSVPIPDSTTSGSTPNTIPPQNGSGGVVYIPIQIKQF